MQSSQTSRITVVHYSRSLEQHFLPKYCITMYHHYFSTSNPLQLHTPCGWVAYFSHNNESRKSVITWNKQFKNKSEKLLILNVNIFLFLLTCRRECATSIPAMVPPRLSSIFARFPSKRGVTHKLRASPSPFLLQAQPLQPKQQPSFPLPQPQNRSSVPSKFVGYPNR